MLALPDETRSKSLDLSVELVPGDRLKPEHLALWHSLQQSSLDVANPCFAPEFIQSVAAVRNDVEVAIIHRDGGVAGFFPFQRKGGRRAIPVGGIVSDYQGLICRPGFRFDPGQLLKACNLVSWDFDRLIATQSSFVRFHWFCEPSAQIDLSNGYAAYDEERRRAGTHQLRHCEYMLRRMERELGPVRFVGHSDDPAQLAQVLAWKSEQYRRSRWNDLFASKWACRLVQRIHETQKTEFAGVLSLLYAGPFLVAGHIGMRSRTIWHYWFPAYARQFARYSPGLVLLYKMIRHAEDLGLNCIDVGTGLSLYKKRLMNTSVSVAEGSVDRICCANLFRSCRRAARAIIRRVRVA